MSTWMYQFWYFSFKTAKHWGRGPQDWTAGMLGFDDYHQQKTISGSSPNTPGMSVGTPATHFSSSGREMSGFLSGNGTQTPSSLCRWSIHCKTPSYKRIPSPPSSPPPNLDLDNEQAWPQWSGPQDSDTFTKKLSDNLASNDFSNVKLDNLPVATNQIAVAAQRSPKELRQEALGFSIMSGNVELIVNIIENIGNDLSSSGLFPFHLAVSYLNGSRQCCNVLNEIQEGFPPALRRLYVNDLGHTILDQLMIAILKSHTSCLPSIVDPTFRKEKRFEGEDVDICGRWDADSDCVRRLLANGTSSIPFEWKHMFCHTSVQAICHCIGTVFGPQWAPNINRPSGLFVRRCSHCGDKLELLALHTLVLVGVHLSQSGCEDENLFGILACLLCLLHNGANPLLVANISIPALLGNDESNECEHEDLDPLELAEKVPANLKSKWSGNLSTGWQIICNVLEHSQKQWKERPSRRKSPSKEREREDEFDTFIEYGDDEMSENGEASNDPYLPIKCSSDEDHENLFGVSKILPSLWAAVQTELLTYRRLGEGDGWISQNFDLESLNDSLLNKEAPGISLVQKPMMNTFCACGEFRTVKDGFGHGYPVTPACPLVDEAAAYYFANLEDWNRSSFITCPEDRCESWFY